MESNVVKVEDFLSNEKVRERHLSKLDVLDKVKELILLPNTELLSTKMVAEYYEVKEVTIKQVYNRNKNELTANGTKTLRGTELQGLKTEIQDVTLLGRANAVTVYSKRAVLNVGMLLAESKIAKEIRTALLDHQEELTDSQKVQSVNEEQLLLLNIIQAQNEGERAIALSEYNEYKNRHVKQLEQQLEEQKPMVEKYGVFVNSDSTFNFTEVAKMISTRVNHEDISFTVTNKSLPKLLRDKGILSKRKSGGNYTNLPNKDYEQYFNVTEIPIENESISFHKANTRVNASGVDFLYGFVKNNI